MAARAAENVFPQGDANHSAETRLRQPRFRPLSAQRLEARDAAVLCQFVGCQRMEWVAGARTGLRASVSGFGGFRGLRAARSEPAPRKPCYTFAFAVETLPATS